MSTSCGAFERTSRGSTTPPSWTWSVRPGTRSSLTWPASRGSFCAAASINDVPPLVGFYYPGTKQEFAASFRENADALAELLDELPVWLREQLSRVEVVAVLGM